MADAPYGTMTATLAPGSTPEEQKRLAEEQKKRSADAIANAVAKRRAEIEMQPYQYGGWSGGANEAATRYAQTGQAAQGRQGEAIDFSGADWDRQMAGYARNEQGSMAALMRARAEGRTPSIAGMMADRQMRQAAAEQTSAAASARGPAALALAQQGAAANTSAMQSNISNQAQINAANERQQAEMNAFGAYSGMRTGDQAAGKMAADQATEQARINAAQRAQNDAFQLGMTGYETDVNKSELAAMGNKVATAAGLSVGQQNINLNKARLEDERMARIMGAGSQVVGTVGTVVKEATSPAPAPAPAAAPAPTAGGFDGNGAPVAGTGGGFDPDKPGSDERMKDVQSWDSVSTRDAAKAYAKQALEAQASPGNQPARELGQQAGESMPGKDRDTTNLARLESKAGLSDREQAERSAIRKRLMGVKGEQDDKAALSGVGLEPGQQDTKLESLLARGQGQAPGAAKAATPIDVATAAPVAPVALAAPRADAPALPAMNPYPVPSTEIQPLAVQPAKAERRVEPAPTMGEQLAAGAFKLGKVVQGIFSDMTGKDPKRWPMVSDDRAKLAQAWDEGHNEALSKMQDMRNMSPDELKALGERGNRIANAVRGTKADAWDEAKGRNGSMVPRNVPTPAPPHTREPTSFTRESPMAASNRALEAQPYAYKPEYAERQGQQVGETNVGPMAQRMAADPVAGTVVKKDENTGLMSLDRDKFAKVTAGGVADLQHQVDEMKSIMAQRMRGGR